MDYSDIVRLEKVRIPVNYYNNSRTLAKRRKCCEGERKTVSADRFIPEGKIIERKDLVLKIGTGIPAELFDYIVGGKALRDIEEDEIFLQDILLSDGV